MNNPWAGKIAKSITSQRRSKRFWNFFFGIIIGIIVVSMSSFAYQVACDHLSYSTVQLYVGYEDGNLVTNINSFKIHNYDDQETSISILIYKVKSNEEITLHISKITDDLLEVKYLGETVYKKKTIPVIPTVIASIVMVIPMLGLCIFMLVVTNIKNPSKRIEKIQKHFLLKTYN